MKRSAAEILHEYGPFPGVDHVRGVTFDGQHVWFASGDKLNAFDPASGKTVRSIDVAAHAGTAFDGQHLFQIAEDRIQRSIRRLAVCLRRSRRPAAAVTRGCVGRRDPLGGAVSDRKIHQIDPKQGRFFAPSSPTASSPE